MFLVDHHLHHVQTSALRKTVMDNEELDRKEVATILERNFYVDDMLKSFSTTEEAITVIQHVKDLCSNGGFNLRLSSATIQQY